MNVLKLFWSVVKSGRSPEDSLKIIEFTLKSVIFMILLFWELLGLRPIRLQPQNGPKSWFQTSKVGRSERFERCVRSIRPIWYGRNDTCIQSQFCNENVDFYLHFRRFFMILKSHLTSLVVFGPNMDLIKKFFLRLKIFKWSSESIFMVHEDF